MAEVNSTLKPRVPKIGKKSPLPEGRGEKDEEFRYGRTARRLPEKVPPV